MTFPLPPSDPRGLQPARSADHERRIHQQEGLALPTPRTYRSEVVGSTPVSTTGTVTLGSIPVVFQPGSIIHLLGRATFSNTTANACTAALVATDPFGGVLDLDVMSGVSLSPSSAGAYGTSGSGAAVAANAATSRWLTEWSGFGGAVPAAAGLVNLEFKLKRTGGTGTPRIAQLVVWAMIL